MWRNSRALYSLLFSVLLAVMKNGKVRQSSGGKREMAIFCVAVIAYSRHDSYPRGEDAAVAARICAPDLHFSQHP
jgi:hypothetical protein